MTDWNRYYIEELKKGTWIQQDLYSIFVGQAKTEKEFAKCQEVWRRYGTVDNYRLRKMTPKEIKLHIIKGAGLEPTPTLTRMPIPILLQEISTCPICSTIVDKDTDKFVETFRQKGKTYRRSAIKHEACDMKERLAQFNKTGHLSTWLLQQAIGHRINVMYAKPESPITPNPTLEAVMEAQDRIESVIRHFEQSVWYSGLQDYVQNIKTKGSSWTVDEHRLMAYTMCGRAMITLESDKGSITLITDETSKTARMGIQGIGATESLALDLLESAIRLWAVGHRLTEDRNVNMGF